MTEVACYKAPVMGITFYNKKGREIVWIDDYPGWSRSGVAHGRQFGKTALNKAAVDRALYDWSRAGRIEVNAAAYRMWAAVQLVHDAVIKLIPVREFTEKFVTPEIYRRAIG